MNSMVDSKANRRGFIQKFLLLGGAGITAAAPGNTAVRWLRTATPAGNGDMIRLDPDPGNMVFKPLETIPISTEVPGGSMETSTLRLLLPGGVRPSSVSINGREVDFSIEMVESSRYMILEKMYAPVSFVEVNL